MQRFFFPFTVLNVGAIAVPVTVPVPVWGLVQRLSIFEPPGVLVSIVALTLVDVPADLLNVFFINRLVAPGGNLNFSVRQTLGGSVTVEGLIHGFRDP